MHLLHLVISSVPLVANFVAAVAIPPYIRHNAQSPSLRSVRTVNGDVKPHSYIVKLADSTDREPHLLWASALVNSSTVSNATSVSAFSPEFYNAYSAELDDDAVSKLLASGDVDWIEADAIVNTQSLQLQANASWGLQRVSASLPLVHSVPTYTTFTYKFDDNGGSGVDVYLIDSGIRTSHVEFQGRASMIWSAPGLGNTDDNGHGTHIAGIVGGKTWGVAKKANLFGLKAMNANGSGSVSDVIAALDFVVQTSKNSTHHPIVNLSLGGPSVASLDAAVTAAVKAGIFVVAAAGNQAKDTANFSPARAPGVITVGASNILDAVWPESNFGKNVDIFAPGDTIISCGVASDLATAVGSGTSMAAPFVAGIIATYLTNQPQLTPKVMPTLLKAAGITGDLSNVPQGTINLLPQTSLPASVVSTVLKNFTSTL